MGFTFSGVRESIAYDCWGSSKSNRWRSTHTHLYCGAGEPRSEGVVPRPKDAMLTFTIVKGQVDGPSLLGTDWLQYIWLDCCQLHTVSMSNLERRFDQKKTLFQPGLSMFKRLKAKIHVDSTGTPKFCKARPVPHARWSYCRMVAPVHPVLKSDQSCMPVRRQ